VLEDIWGDDKDDGYPVCMCILSHIRHASLLLHLSHAVSLSVNQ